MRDAARSVVKTPCPAVTATVAFQQPETGARRRPPLGQRVKLLFVLFLLLPTPALAQDQSQLRNSGWLSADKPKHFAISGTTTVLVTAVVDYAGASENVALVTGITTSVLIGVAKEWLDHRAGRFMDPKDLVWDAAGIAVGAVLTRWIMPGASAPPDVPAPPPPFLAEPIVQPAAMR